MDVALKPKVKPRQLFQQSTNHLIFSMTHKINASNTAAVANNVHWIPIDQHTPLGVKLQLISRQSGIAVHGTCKVGELFYTHWAPLPTFAPNDTHGVNFEYLKK